MNPNQAQETQERALLRHRLRHIEELAKILHISNVRRLLESTDFLRCMTDTMPSEAEDCMGTVRDELGLGD